VSAARRYGTAALVLGVLVLAVLGLLRAAGAGSEPSLGEQADAVASTLRCPTCEGLSIADSQSGLAAGSRQVIEDQLAQGRTPDQVRQYFVDRYGEYVLLSPDPSGPGLLAWVVPALAVLLAGLAGWRWLARSRRSRVPAGGAPQEAAEALTAFRAGRLDPDDSPAGEALREALLVRLSAGEDEVPDAGTVHRADLRLAAAARRWSARRDPVRTGTPGRALPRRALTVGVAALVVLAATTGLVLGVRDRGTAAVPTGAAPGAAAADTGTADLEAATRSDPQDAAAWVALGRAYDRQQRFPEAVEAYDRALALQPGADDVTLLRTNVLVRSGRAAEALPALQELAGRYPDDPDVLLVLGLAQQATGAPEAAATLRRFLDLAPDSPAAPGVRALLEDR
jgi:cytochrome c-type biogenesis protein CcmH